MHNFWDYISIEHRNLASVNFLQFQCDKTANLDSDKKGDIWCRMLPFAPDDLEIVFESIMKNNDFKLLYEVEDSVLWKFFGELENLIP